jgi:DksA/TraR C4-type zinc finger protein
MNTESERQLWDAEAPSDSEKGHSLRESIVTAEKAMETIIDVDLNHRFWPNLGAAREAAAIQAANTGAVVATVESVEIQSHQVTFVGTVPESAVSGCVGLSARPRLRSFHTTWGALLNPGSLMGFLVIAPPLNCRSFDADIPEVSRIALAVPRMFATIPPKHLGKVCCCECRQPISLARLQALPGARLCTGCQRQKELENANH